MIHHLPAVSRRTLLGAAAGIPTAALLAGCTGSGAAVRSGTDQVTMLTSFGLLGRDAYPFVAIDQGYFDETRINVEVQPGNGTQQNLQLLLGGEAQFVAIDLSGAIIARGGGTTGYVALAAIHQLAPAALMTVDPDITDPRDLAGRTIAMTGGAILELLWPAYAQQNDMDPGDATIVNVDPPQLISVLAGGQADVIEQFAMGLPTVQAAVGDRNVTVLPYSDVLTDLYGVVLVTTTERAVEQPELCTRFRDALLRGLDYSLTNPDEAGRILAAVDEAVDPQVAAAELQAMEPYVRQAGVPLGAIDEIRVARSIALLEAIGTIPAGMTAGEVVDLDLAIAAGQS